jgi:hypothetical protein
MNLEHWDEETLVVVEGGVYDEEPCSYSDSKDMLPYSFSISELAHPIIWFSNDGISTSGG